MIVLGFFISKRRFLDGTLVQKFFTGLFKRANLGSVVFEIAHDSLAYVRTGLITNLYRVSSLVLSSNLICESSMDLTFDLTLSE